MDNANVFRFASLRDVAEAPPMAPETVIQPTTALVDQLVGINGSTATPTAKMQQFNAALQAYIGGTDFIKTKAQFQASLADSGTPEYLERLYDNVVARVLSRGNNSAIFKLVAEQLRSEHFLEQVQEFPELRKRDLRIVLPEGLLYSFMQHAPSTAEAPSSSPSLEDSAIAYQNYQLARELVDQARHAQVVRFLDSGRVAVTNSLHTQIIDSLNLQESDLSTAERSVSEMLSNLSKEDMNIDVNRLRFRQAQQLMNGVRMARQQGIQTLERESIVHTQEYERVLSTLGVSSIGIDEADRLLTLQMKPLSHQLFSQVPKDTYTLYGDTWIHNSGGLTYSSLLPYVGEDGIFVYSDGCWLKFPFQIADLRVVEQEAVGYLPAEIAHINNTQPGEEQTRVTRRLKRLETEESLIEESEVTRETDTQSTEKFGFEREASQVQQEESSWNVNASVSASFGPVTASVSGGYESSESSTASNSFAQSYAREVVQKVVDRVSNRVKRERSTKTLEEFEETVTHVIDNTLADGPKSYVYRWLNKLTRATLKNYGKRLIFQIDIAHPAHYHVARTLKAGETVVLPQDPRTMQVSGVTIDHPTKITRDNYLAIADLYRAKVENPPAERVFISKGFVDGSSVKKVEEITLPKGYGAHKGKFNGTTWNNNLIMTIASSAIGWDFWDSGTTNDTIFEWINGGIGANEFTFSYNDGALITESVAITFFGGPYTINFEIECKLMPDAYLSWQTKTFNAIVEAYIAMREEAEAKMGSFNPNLPGLNPQEKLTVIRTELKKEAIRKMMRCRPLGIVDEFEVGKEYHSECCVDNKNAELVRFLETVFDWRNLTYEFFPYFYSSRDVIVGGQKVKDNWDELLKLKDSDPHFESFLQASYASIRIPVHRERTKEIAAINFILNNSVANFEVVPESALPILDELELNPVTQFEYDLDGNLLPAPVEIVQLGIFKLPTDLVILECGTQDGVKPIGFPQDPNLPDSDVMIPKQYSPAIIADTCNP